MNLISENEYTPELQAIVSCITEITSVEKICLTGFVTTLVQTETIFSDAKEPWQAVTEYNLLILTAPSVPYRKSALQDTIENRCRQIVPITAFIMPMEEYNTLAADGHPFAVHTYYLARLVYDAQSIPFVLPPYRESSVQELKEAYCYWSRMAGEFLTSVDLFIVNKQFRLAALMLHQAAEFLYVAILLLHTGYRFVTHNLEKLFRYSRGFSNDLFWLFPQHTAEEKRLFRKLQQSYIESRYSTTYKIRKADLQTLTERVRRLQGIARTLYRKHFENSPSLCHISEAMSDLCRSAD